MHVSLSGLATRAAAHAARRAVPALLRGGAEPARRSALAVAAEHLLAGPQRHVRGDRHALLPAAMRVERSRLRRGDRTADHMALTVWFGEGPALPGPAWHGAARRAAVGVGAGMMGAALLAAAAVRLGAPRDLPRVVDATAVPAGNPPSVPQPGEHPAAGTRPRGDLDGDEALAVGAEHLP